MDGRNIIRMKKLNVLIVFAICVVFSPSTNADEIGNITVYVKDQNGDNVIDNSHLVGDLTVELWYEGDKVKTRSFEEGNESVLFTVNHTGTYTVRAVAVLQFVDVYGCSIISIAPKIFECEKKCPDGIDTVDVDDMGIYTCTPGLDVPSYRSHYGINHTYIVVNDVLTYVDEGENDKTQVTLFTDFETLGKYGRQYLTLSNETRIFGAPKSIYWTLPSSIIEEGIATALDKGIIKNAWLSNPTATVLLISIEDPDSLFMVESGSKILISSVSGGTIGRLVTLGYLTGPQGFVLSVIISTGVEVTWMDWHEEDRCKNALTDDLDIFIGQPTRDCTPWYPLRYPICLVTTEVCDRYPITLVNQGEYLSDIYADNLGGTSCKEFANDIEKGIENMEVKNKFINWTHFEGTCDISPPFCFNGSGRLRHKLKLLPGRYCDFDTLLFSDPPKLSQFQKNTPYIASPDFPEMLYVGDNFTVSAVMVDDRGISNAKINWTYTGSGTQSGSSPMQKVSGTDMHSLWEGTSSRLSDYNEGFVSFFVNATDTDTHSTVNDNDQRLYRIRVIEDSDYGGDVPDVKADAYRVSPSAFGRVGWLWPQPGEF